MRDPQPLIRESAPGICHFQDPRQRQALTVTADFRCVSWSLSA